MTKTMDSAAFKAAHQEGLEMVVLGCYNSLNREDYSGFEQAMMAAQGVIGNIGRKKFFTEDPDELEIIQMALNQWFGALEDLFQSEECHKYMESIDAIVQNSWDRFKSDDGGREAAGYSGEVRDCVVRSISIGTGIDYRSIWEHFDALIDHSPDDGLFSEHGWEYLECLNWDVRNISQTIVLDVARQGLTAILETHLLGDSHWTVVKNGIIHDTWNTAGVQVIKAYYPPME